ncbi:lipocalin-like domain-containing protein [Ekhidna sp.]|uniref:lipocalin-like domain-containing protein n=1 Tax=Ekhidna sp. TaxID=2608089 RepID=UPI003B501257
MKDFITISFLIISCFTSCEQKTSSTQNDETGSINAVVNMENMKMINDKFVGSWELKEWTAKLTDESIIFPFGEDAIGRITYDSNGNMAVQIMKNNRKQFLSEDPLQAQPDEVVVAYNGFIAYCGNYEVNLNSNQVVHQIKISSFPNWIGQNQIRNFEFNEDELTLSTDQIGSSRHKLVWRKIDN